MLTGLDDYISRMKDTQSTIYYIATESEELAANSPFVENLVKKDVEVLYFTEPIDEWCAGQLAEYEGKKLVDVTKEGLELEDEEKERIEKATEELKVRQGHAARLPRGSRACCHGDHRGQVQLDEWSSASLANKQLVAICLHLHLACPRIMANHSRMRAACGGLPARDARWQGEQGLRVCAPH